MASVLDRLLERTPPRWVRKIEAALMMGVFAEAFCVEPPEVEDLSAEDALTAFREFTAACMEAALADESTALQYRVRLGACAYEFSARVRRALKVGPRHAFALVRFFYRGIGIELSGELPGNVRFGPCSFGARYTPQDCWFMSAFDEGFMRGMMGLPEADLAFSCRISEGAPCCRATFEG